MEFNEVFQMVGPIIAIVALFVSIISFINTKNKNEMDAKTNEDKEISEYAISLLERAYKTLTDNGDHTNPPKANRLNWLTSARYICRFHKLKSSLKILRYILICEENEEQWRHEFYKLFKNSEFNHLGYFSGTHMCNSIENIEPNSAVIITEFAQWNANYVDPIDSYDFEESISKKPNILNGQIGLKAYLDALKNERQGKSEEQT
ncbi:hypothetical protein [Aliivibrio logei]|uniref:hypothetical protein n=1 Tax=Aliivibrio logei TaxID=688 RepID=UPI0003A0771C|nr:hypothetical protein [Aliivibrio logei]